MHAPFCIIYWYIAISITTFEVNIMKAYVNMLLTHIISVVNVNLFYSGGKVELRFCGKIDTEVISIFLIWCE